MVDEARDEQEAEPEQPGPMTLAALAGLMAEQAGFAEPPSEFKLSSSGIVLALHPIPPERVRMARAGVPRPQAPRVFIEGKDREEENPGDPDYQAALRQWELDAKEAELNAAFAVGTSIKEVPEGKCRPEDDAWIEDLEAVGVVLSEAQRTNRILRYLAWLRLYALQTNTEIMSVTLLCQMRYTVLMPEVVGAMQAFRDHARGRRPADGAADGLVGQDGNRAPATG